MLPIQYSTVDKADHKLSVGGVVGLEVVNREIIASQDLRTFKRMDISAGGAYSLTTLTN